MIYFIYFLCLYYFHLWLIVLSWASNYTSVGAQSSRFLVKSDYLSIKSAQIGYNFDKKLLDTVGLRNFRVYVAGENLYAWTAKKGLEPSQSFSGTTTYRYTPSRTVSFGINLSF